MAAIPVDAEEARREWVYKLAQTFKARFPIAWGTKRADPTRPQSKDVICYESAGRLVGWDVVLGTEPPTLNPNADSMDLTGQVFIPVEAHDWLSVLPPVEPEVPIPPVVVPDPSTLEARVAKIEAFLSSLPTWG